jgi:hypothetical protein
MLGVKKIAAGADLSKKRAGRRAKNEYEEWSGFGTTP